MVWDLVLLLVGELVLEAPSTLQVVLCDWGSVEFHPQRSSKVWVPVAWGGEK
jgi:hypothetical protein